MPSEYDLRLATSRDLAAVETIVADAYTPFIQRIGRKPGPMLDDYAAQIAEQRVWVLDADGVQGILVLIPEADAMLLDNVAIAPSAQGKGFGRVLMDFAEEQARAAGLQAIRLYTNQAMTENVAIYLKRGYVRDPPRHRKGPAPGVYAEGAGVAPLPSPCLYMGRR